MKKNTVKTILMIVTIVVTVGCLCFLGYSSFALVKSVDIGGIVDNTVSALKDVKSDISDDDPSSSSSTSTSENEDEPIIDPVIEEDELYQVTVQYTKELEFSMIGSTFDIDEILKLDVESIKGEVLTEQNKETILDAIKVKFDIENKNAEIKEGKIKITSSDSGSFEDTLLVSFELLKEREDTNYSYVKGRIIKIKLSFHKASAEENKEYFEKIYDNYEDSSAELQKKIMSKVINNSVNTDDDYSNAVSSVVEIYVEKLFENIADRREVGGEEVRNEFTSVEGEAYSGLMEIVNVALNEKTEYKPEKETIVSAIEDVVNSSVCTETVDESINDENVLEIVQKVSRHMDTETREKTEGSFVEVAETLINTDPEKFETCKKLAELLSIDLDELMNK